MTARAYIALGSNLGDPLATVQAAFAALRTLPETTLVAASSLYRSAPVGLKHQPDFINAVAAVDTALVAEALLEELFAIEARFGRRRDFHEFVFFVVATFFVSYLSYFAMPALGPSFGVAPSGTWMWISDF